MHVFVYSSVHIEGVKWGRGGVRDMNDSILFFYVRQNIILWVFSSMHEIAYLVYKSV